MSKNRNRVWIPEWETTALPDKHEQQPITLTLSAGTLAAVVEVELIDAETGRVKEYYKFSNLITTTGMDGLMTDNSEIGFSNFNDMMNNLFIGTGSTTPSPSDTKLDEPVDNTTNNGGFGDISGYVEGVGGGPFDLGNPYHFIRKTRVFTESEANHATLSELGWRNIQSSPEFQFTRALIKDSNGDPITINKTDEDQLRVTYEMRLYPPTAQFGGLFVMAGSDVSHSWTGSATDIDQPDTWGYGNNGILRNMGIWRPTTLGDDITAYPSATVLDNPTGTLLQWGWTGPDQQSSNFSRSLFSYVSESNTQVREATFDTARVNFGGTGIIAIGVSWVKGPSQFGILFNPAIIKTDLQKLKLVHAITVTASVTASL